MPIQYVGLKILTEQENSTLNRVVKKALPKVERDYKKSKIILTIKKYNQEGKRSRFSLHSQLNAPSIKFTAKADSWEFATALHKIFNKLETEIIKKTGLKPRQKTVHI